MVDLWQLIGGFAAVNSVLCGLMLMVMRYMLAGVSARLDKHGSEISHTRQDNLHVRLSVERMKADLAVDYATRKEHDSIVRDEIATHDADIKKALAEIKDGQQEILDGQQEIIRLLLTPHGQRESGGSSFPNKD